MSVSSRNSPSSDGGAALAGVLFPSLLHWRGRARFLLDFDEQESWSDLRDLDTCGQIDLILREQKVIDPISHLREAHTARTGRDRMASRAS